MGSRLPCAHARTHACACDRASGPPPDRPLCAGGTWHPPRCFGFWFSSAHHGLGKHSTSFRQPKFPERRPILHPKEGSWARRPPEVPESPGEPRPSANASRGKGRKVERERPQLRPGRMPSATSPWLGLGRRGLSKAPLRHVPWAGSGESPPPRPPKHPKPRAHRSPAPGGDCNADSRCGCFSGVAAPADAGQEAWPGPGHARGLQMPGSPYVRTALGGSLCLCLLGQPTPSVRVSVPRGGC